VKDQAKRATFIPRAAVLLSACLIPQTITTPGSFASGASSIACVETKAVGHAPIPVPVPTLNPQVSLSQIILHTNCGDITIDTSKQNAPLAKTSYAQLASHGYFDNTLCHRLTTSGIFVLQCGDPTATGSGGPNWSFGDENLPPNKPNNYPAGTLAMANSGPSTNGSQFFLVYSDTTLPPNYTIWGQVTSGLEIIK
jgi:peptidyl-prolyl cis-trans isomerase B (cyclophilin B)